MFIRSLKISDYDEIYKLWSHTEGMCICSAADSMSAIQRFLLRNPSTCFVAEIAGKIVGVILSGHDGRNASIYHMAVEPLHRGKGVGTALLNAVINALKNEGINKIGITVLLTNGVGNRFWEKAGFKLNSDIAYREFFV